MFRQLQSRIGTIWCRLAHDSFTWPIHGRYECRLCGRRYPAFVDEPRANLAQRGALKPALPILLAVVLTSFVHPANAEDAIKGFAVAEPEMALERYIAGGESAPWPISSIEIHAALPGINKTGQLLAIRRLATIGENRYEVLQLSGDRTVKDQVIVRYLHAEERAMEIPPAAIAISPANYKFAYQGVVDDGERKAYVFRITPRRKREGLIKGELWLDQRTGVPVRRSGRLVKSPSVFIRRIAITQENDLREGIVESRLTRISVDTRLVGRAQLVIQERPLVSADAARFATWGDGGGQQ